MTEPPTEFAGYKKFLPEVGVGYDGLYIVRDAHSAVQYGHLCVYSEAESYGKTYFRKIADEKPLDPKGDAGSKKAPLWLLPPVALEVASWAHKHGADKYGLFNWRENKVCASTYISAMMRHLNAWRDGEDSDQGSGVSHLAHVIASANILLDAAHCRNLKDDRVKLPGLSPQCPD